jgi:hypothetical protein
MTIGAGGSKSRPAPLRFGSRAAAAPHILVRAKGFT